MSPLLPTATTGSASPVAGSIASSTASAQGPRSAAPTQIAEPVEPIGSSRATDALDQRLRRAATALYGDREVQVETVHDDSTGRTVVRVRDRVSGEVVAQTPPEELLRFWATARQEPPLVDIRT